MLSFDNINGVANIHCSNEGDKLLLIILTVSNSQGTKKNVLEALVSLHSGIAETTFCLLTKINYKMKSDHINENAF